MAEGKEWAARAERAIETGDAGLMRDLLAEGLDPNSGASDQERWVCEAGRRGSSAVFLALLEAGADPSAPDGCGETPLMACCRMDFGQADSEWGAGLRRSSISAREGLAGEDPIQCFEAKVKGLAAAGAAMNSRRFGAAHALDSPYGTRFERPLEVFEILAGAGLDLNAPIVIENGGSLLHAAVEAGASEAVERLLELGCDPLMKDARGKTPLERSLAAPWPRMVQALRVATERAELAREAPAAPRRGAKGL